MTNNDNQSDDKELKAYLDGRDGVSAAYQRTATEEPGQQLDALILQAAHAAVANKPQPQRTQLRGLFSLAASLLVGVMIGAVFMGYLELDSSASENFASDSLAVSAPAENDSAKMEEAAASPPQMNIADELLILERVPEAVESAADSAVSSQRFNLAPQTAPPMRAQRETVSVQPAAIAPVPATATLPANPPLLATTPLPGAVPAPTVASAASPAPAAFQRATAPQPDLQEDFTDLEEVVVTGARIERRDFSVASPILTTTDPITPDWRATSTTWLQHIADLRIAQTTLLDELDATDQELSEEEELFRQAWPEVPMEEALEQLMEGRQ